jgi:phage-related minor tail protein
MSGPSLDIALRIQAELNQAAAQLDQFNAKLASTGGTARASGDGLKAQTTAVRDLFAQIDPTIKKLDQLDKQLSQLRAQKASGLIDDDEFARFSTAIEASRNGLNKAGQAMHSFSLNTSMARLELGRLVKDLATGQYGRLEQTGLTLASYSGLMSAAFSPAGLAIGATLASLGLLSAALIKNYEDEQKFNEALLSTGNYAGVTGSALQQMASNLGASSGEFSTSHDAVLKLAESGRFAGDALGVAAQAAVNMAQLTGISLDKAVGDIVRLQDDPVRAVKALNDQYHFLTASTYQQIQALEDEGKKEQAAALAQKEFSDALATRVQQDIANMAPLERAWRTLNSQIHEGLQLLLQAGSTSVSHQLDVYYAKRGDIQDDMERGSGKPVPEYVDGKTFNSRQAAIEYIDQRIAALKELGDAQDAVAKKQSDDAKEQSAGIAAVDHLHALAKGYDQIADKAEVIKKLNADIALQWQTTATLPKGVDMAADGGYSGAGYDYLVKRALGESTKPHKPRNTNAVQREAVAAQQELIKLLGDEQGKVDPVAKAWATYNDKVTEANKLADKAKLAKGANVAAINAERDALIQSAAAARDADLAKPAEKARKAFEELRNSLKDADGVRFDHVQAQLEQLNDDLKKGVITAKEYSDTASMVLQNGAPKLPHYRGLDAVVGGPLGEVSKIDEQRQTLEKDYQKQLADLDKYHADALHSEEVYLSRKKSLEDSYRTEKKALDDAQTRAELAGITQSLSQAASLIGQGLGKQSAAYRAAFAVSKAAAIAEATVNLFKAISNASADQPWPENLATMAQVGAQGAALISQIMSINAGFSAGGYTGNGAKDQPAGIVHAGEWVQPQYRMKEAGAMAFMADFQRMGMSAIHTWSLAGYADGGFVSPLHDAPRLPAPAVPAARLPTVPANGGNNRTPTLALRNINVIDPAVVSDYLNSSDAEVQVMNIISRNQSRVRQIVK